MPINVLLEKDFNHSIYDLSPLVECFIIHYPAWWCRTLSPDTIYCGHTALSDRLVNVLMGLRKQCVMLSGSDRHPLGNHHYNKLPRCSPCLLCMKWQSADVWGCVYARLTDEFCASFWSNNNMCTGWKSKLQWRLRTGWAKVRRLSHWLLCQCHSSSTVKWLNEPLVVLWMYVNVNNLLFWLLS